MKNRNRSISCRAAALSAMSLFGSSAIADEIKYGGINYPNVTIVGMREGRLYFEAGAGEKNVSLDQIQAIKLDKWPDLAKADAAMDAKDYPGAAKILTGLADKVQADYLKALVNAKLVFALDRSGDFGSAVRQYLKLLTLDSGALATAAMPRNLPADPEVRKKLAGGFEGDLKTSADPGVHAYLEKLVAQLKAEAGTPAATPNNPAAEPAAGVLGGENEAKRDVIAEMVKAGKTEEALKAIEAQLDIEGSDMSRLYLQRGQVYEAMGKDMDALISYLRVVIHFQRSSSGVPAAISAGKILVKMNKPEKAKALWTEAKQQTADADVQKEIEGLLATLSK
jgi:hypothetical protein